ncbi:MAG: uracil-DNA glycosylase [Acidimicrobiia bacterium]|nr:uracil-DNA glycosylase [bacterium]MXY75285.1 uracil-DNA glycosylase [Acidimicrobiia bacterium]MYA39840.1 uracil-DNA glycosylase [Acidimicrobiia bacterium]MYG92893.1 uracil-DNA glycosylase [Acidimicrobiia bacterium]MYH06408.1 uracil-DNA glycosylase [Acidimicrobiia bacterium]
MQELAALGARASVCTDCRLSESRTNVVFGVGRSDADVMMVGEAPGRNEDLEGEPFVGAAGRLLNRLLDEVGMGRHEVYIANVLKCRPPHNRDPRPDEIESCKGYLRGQLDLVDPKVVMTLGNFATQLLLRTNTGISRMRGRSYKWWKDKVLIPTFHPAAALRGGERVTDQIREDLALMRSVLDSMNAGEGILAEPEQMGLF